VRPFLGLERCRNRISDLERHRVFEIPDGTFTSRTVAAVSPFGLSLVSENESSSELDDMVIGRLDSADEPNLLGLCRLLSPAAPILTRLPTARRQVEYAINHSRDILFG